MTRHRPTKTARLYAQRTRLDAAREAHVTHAATCDICRAGVLCNVGARLRDVALAAASDELPWSAP